MCKPSDFSDMKDFTAAGISCTSSCRKAFFRFVLLGKVMGDACASGFECLFDFVDVATHLDVSAANLTLRLLPEVPVRFVLK